MSTDAYVKAMQQIRLLTPEEQLQLLEELIKSIRLYSMAGRPFHSILELEGLGKEIWQDVDIQGYLKRERASWHENE